MGREAFLAPDGIFLHITGLIGGGMFPFFQIRELLDLLAKFKRLSIALKNHRANVT